MSGEAQTAPSGLLYIEDNQSNLQLVKRVFRDREDVDLRTAIRGQEGLEMAKADPPALILLDLHLPDMPGSAVLAELKQDETTASIPVVAVSADATPVQIDQIRAAGVADYVTKPFDIAALLSVVDRLIATHAESTAGGHAEDDAILDQRRVAELIALDDDGETFRELADLALDEAARYVAIISSAATDALPQAAHGLHSSASSIGASRLAALSSAVERAARTGSRPGPAVLAQLRTTLTATRLAAREAVRAI